MSGDHATGRDIVHAALRRELLGPPPAGGGAEPEGMPLDCDAPVRFPDWPSSNGPWHEAATREEILTREAPSRRYGVGVLTPVEAATAHDDSTLVPGTAVADAEAADRDGRWSGSEQGLVSGADDADFDLSGANDIRPSAVGISFLARTPPGSVLEVRLTGGRYRSLPVRIGDDKRDWWVRSPVEARWRLRAEDLRPGASTRVPHSEMNGVGTLDLELDTSVRPREDGSRLITVALVNRTHVPDAKSSDAQRLFQCELSVRIDGSRDAEILPYPERPSASSAQEDDASFRLLYRRMQTYAVGHGCAADWAATGGDGRVTMVRSDPLPSYETPSTTPDIVLPDKSRLQVSMAALAGLDPGDDGMLRLRTILDEYEAWIARLEGDPAGSDPCWQEAARRHTALCREALGRMREGLELVQNGPPEVRRAFRLANQAMLEQQLRTRREARKASSADGRVSYADPRPTADWRNRPDRGQWRAFQIAFLLAAIPSTTYGGHQDRSTVDLIFFPTGGGKTEAYLGLSAYSLLLRRLRDRDDCGVDVLMRYTLRLLTTQQFLRASSLVCALEMLRRDSPDLGSQPFSIGIWLGGESTPNWKKDARAALKALQENQSYQANPFLLLRCPWCAAEMGPVRPAAAKRRGRRTGSETLVLGYEQHHQNVVFRCPDNGCEFSGRTLPVHVVDEDVYERRPSIVIGTVDKFAMLAWRPEARSLFGIGADGRRAYSPPTLVVQDELHLISGPLGSMTGLYEAVVEALCTDHRTTPPTLPKIIASTATIRRHEQQVSALYGRSSVRLFPPHGLDAGDSFFARHARDDEGRLLPGRRYVGVFAPGLGSMQTVQVRTYAALLQAAQSLPEAQRDPWWTLMSFFNSLRELGNSLSLLQSDVPDYLKALRNRSGTAQDGVRRVFQVKEMTSRLRQDEIPKAMEELARTAANPTATDVCLASSLIEVGIDIDRLSLMCIVGQPKSTSQYIQVSGRVGRNWEDRPGLVATLYGAAKPRDRSHFERFRSYHERLYASVEPTSVTPFAPPVVDRALHAVVTAYIRQLGAADDVSRPDPFPDALYAQAEALLHARAQQCDPEAAAHVGKTLERRRREWLHWEPKSWDPESATDGDGVLLRRAGSWADDAHRDLSWETPMSMRAVDAECRAQVTTKYAQGGGQP